MFKNLLLIASIAVLVSGCVKVEKTDAQKLADYEKISDEYHEMIRKEYYASTPQHPIEIDEENMSKFIICAEELTRCTVYEIFRMQFECVQHMRDMAENHSYDVKNMRCNNNGKIVKLNKVEE